MKDVLKVYTAKIITPNTACITVHFVCAYYAVIWTVFHVFPKLVWKENTSKLSVLLLSPLYKGTEFYWTGKMYLQNFVAICRKLTAGGYWNNVVCFTRKHHADVKKAYLSLRFSRSIFVRTYSSSVRKYCIRWLRVLKMPPPCEHCI